MNLPKLAAALALCLLAGILGSFFTATSDWSWYSSLVKPAFNPPSWIFAPVWTFLYILMGFSLYFLLEAEAKPASKWESLNARKLALAFFCIQLFLNFLWSALFFGLNSPALALLEIGFLWLSILATILFAYRVSKNAALLLLPYILWVSFAAFLNYSIFLLNP